MWTVPLSVVPECGVNGTPCEGTFGSDTFGSGVGTGVDRVMPTAGGYVVSDFAPPMGPACLSATGV